MQPHYVDNPSVFDHHNTQGMFLIADNFHDGPTKNCGYRHGQDQIVELEASQDVLYFYPLSSDLALGEEVIWQRYDAAYLTPDWVQPTQTGPLALWNLSTGTRLVTLQGYHLGHIRGARLLDDNRLVTWARDFLLRVWDVQTGIQQEIVPLPAALDQAGTPIVSSRTCTDWTDAQFEAYLMGNTQPLSFAVTLMIKTEQATRTESFARAAREPVAFTQHVFERDRASHHIPEPFQELEGVEASYSDSVVLSDNRLLIGGITYGSPNHTYVWDGGLQLLILYTSLNDGANLEIDGELAPGVIQLRNYKTSVTFNVGRDPGEPA